MQKRTNIRRLASIFTLLTTLLLGYHPSPGQAQVVTPVPDKPNPLPGEVVSVQVNVADVTDLYAASFDLVYNPSVLTYQETVQGSLLGAPTTEASMLVAPQSDQVIVGISRLGDIGGVSGSGTLATVKFQVTGSYCSASDITFGNAYLEGPEQDSLIAATWNQGSLTVTLLSPSNPGTTDPGTHNQINLSWNAVTDATEYEIYRSNTPGGPYSMIGATATNSYQDTNCILPTLAYYYQVKAKSGATCMSELSPEISGMAAGLLGDINNDGRVNGRDLSRLSRVFGKSCGQPKYDCRADLDRSCLVDGDDLSLLAADFGKTL